MANSARGKFPQGADLITGRESGSLVSPHSHWGDTGDMGSSSCVSAPLLCLGVWAVLSSLVIACLNFFLHQCNGRSLRSVSSSMPTDCVETGPQFSQTNLDILNVDISEKDLLATAEQVKCDCTWELLEWGLFEISVVVLLVLIFCYLFMSDGMSHFVRFLKKRNSDESRLQRELDLAISKQNKLMKKMGKSGAFVSAPTAQAPNVDDAQQFSAL